MSPYREPPRRTIKPSDPDALPMEIQRPLPFVVHVALAVIVLVLLVARYS